MKHLLLIPNNVDTWSTLPASEIEAIMQAHTSLQQELSASGEFVEAHELGEEVKFVRRNGSACTVTDGPLIETKEIVAGSTTSSTAWTWPAPWKLRASWERQRCGRSRYAASTPDPVRVRQPRVSPTSNPQAPSGNALSQ